MKAATGAVRVSTKDSTAFQSTPPVKAATFSCFRVPSSAAISIHAAREGGDTDGSDEYARIMISIHAAREGGDTEWNLPELEGTISIHAAREGGDTVAV